MNLAKLRMLSVRLPDLWLKRAMTMKLLPFGVEGARIQNRWFAQCVRGDTAKDALFNQWLAGDTKIGTGDDLHLLAGTLERLILEGNPGEISHATVKKYLATGRPPILLPGLLGTFSEFSAALNLLLERRSDYHELGGEKHIHSVLAHTVRHELIDALDEHTEPAGMVQILHGKTRDWVGSIGAGEKIIRQRSAVKNETIEKGEFVQLVIPPTIQSRLAFGFEVRMDDGLITDPWEDSGSWLGDKLQLAGKATLLFNDPVDDADAPLVDVEGTFCTRIISVDAEQSANFLGICEAVSTDKTAKGIMDGCPDNWPAGYAKTIALVTYVKRAAYRVKRVHNRNAEEVRLAAEFPKHISKFEEEPMMPRLYKGNYVVV